MKQADVFVAAAKRTPFAALGGALARLSAPQISAALLGAMRGLFPFPLEMIDEVIIGQVLQGGSGQAPARQAMRLAGFPDSIPACTINKVCGSGLYSLMLAANAIRAGEAQLVIAGGMESMSQAPYISTRGRFSHPMGHERLLDLMLQDGLQDPYSSSHMGEITEEWIEKHGMGRAPQDDYAERSYHLARNAIKKGLFAEEIVPISRDPASNNALLLDDELPTRANLQRLRQLPPVFRKRGTITAANASSLSDGAALTLIASSQAVKEYDLTPLARLKAATTWAMAPGLFPETDIHAVNGLLKKTGLKKENIGLFEINEAFAAVALLTIEGLDVDINRVNVNGGAVALGHPLGASGARLATTLIYEMRRRSEQYGIATLCLGGGEAVAVLFELV